MKEPERQMRKRNDMKEGKNRVMGLKDPHITNIFYSPPPFSFHFLYIQTAAKEREREGEDKKGREQESETAVLREQSTSLICRRFGRGMEGMVVMLEVRSGKPGGTFNLLFRLHHLFHTLQVHCHWPLGRTGGSWIRKIHTAASRSRLRAGRFTNELKQDLRHETK